MPEPETTKAKPTEASMQTTPEEPTKSFQESEDKMLDQVDDLYKSKISGSKVLQEIAKGNLLEQKEKHKQAISDLYKSHRTEFDEKIGKENVSNRQALLAEVLGSADKEAKEKIAQIEGVLKTSLGEKTYMDDEAVNKMIEDCKKIEKLAQADAKTQELTNKLLQRQELTEADYQYVISILNPYDVTSQLTGDQTTCDATSGGIFVGFMRPDQRFKLMDMFMDSGKRNDAPQIIDAFIRTKALSGYQAELLLNGDAKGFKGAVQRGIITPEQYRTDFKAKFENGYYEQEIAKYEKMLKEISDKIPSGNYANGTMNRVVGRPMIGGIMAVWGAIVTALNISANWKDKKSWAKNPYIYAGAAAMLAGTEMATGTWKQGSSTFGDGVIGSAWDRLTEPGTVKLNAEQKAAGEKIAEIVNPVKSPMEMIEYLDGGGYESLLAVRKQKQQAGATGDKLLVTIDDLVKLDTDKSPERTRMLNGLKTKSKEVQDSVTVKLNQVAEMGINILKFDKNDQFSGMLANIRGVQTGASPAAGAASPSAMAANQPPAVPASPMEAPPPAPVKPPIAPAPSSAEQTPNSQT